MSFTAPDWLYLLIVPVILLPLLAAAGAAKRRKIVGRLLGVNAGNPEALRVSRARRFWRVLLLSLAAAFLVIAAARPSLYSRLLPSEPKGRDILVLCDVSRSMNAADIAPSRLKHAQFLLRQLASRERNDRFGLALFAGDAYLSCPLTSDPVTFNEYVDEISTDSVPAGGTNLEKALKVALKAFDGSEGSSRAVILLTDGEELQGNIKSVTAELRKKNIPIFAVGFGDPVNGSVIPREPGGSALIRDKNNKVVTSKLNEKLLSSLAAETRGIYVRTTVTDPGLAQLESAISHLERTGRKSVKRHLPVEEFPKALAAAAAALLVFLLLSERKNAAVLLFLALCTAVPGSYGAELKASEKKALPSLEKAQESCEQIYNQARQMQLSGKAGFEGLYQKVISREKPGSALYSSSFHNLGAGVHNSCRKLWGESVQKLKGQQLNEALKTLNEALEISEGARELYSRSAVGAEHLPAELSANLTRLARDKKKMEELKKKIEELMKQQQKAQDKSRQAQQQNQKTPQDQQQKQQQQRSIDQAQKAAQDLQKQAGQMDQKQMAEAARKAADELKKASEAKKQDQHKKSSEHIRKALRELAQGKEKETGKEGTSQKKASDSKEPSGGKPGEKMPRKGDKPSPAQAEELKKAADKKGAEQLLELMGEDDKKLRSAIKKRSRMRRQQNEKDW